MKQKITLALLISFALFGCSEEASFDEKAALFQEHYSAATKTIVDENNRQLSLMTINSDQEWVQNETSLKLLEHFRSTVQFPPSEFTSSYKVSNVIDLTNYNGKNGSAHFSGEAIENIYFYPIMGQQDHFRWKNLFNQGHNLTTLNEKSKSLHSELTIAENSSQLLNISRYQGQKNLATIHQKEVSAQTQFFFNDDYSQLISSNRQWKSRQITLNGEGELDKQFSLSMQIDQPSFSSLYQAKPFKQNTQFNVANINLKNSHDYGRFAHEIQIENGLIAFESVEKNGIFSGTFRYHHDQFAFSLYSSPLQNFGQLTATISIDGLKQIEHSEQFIEILKNMMLNTFSELSAQEHQFIEEQMIALLSPNLRFEMAVEGESAQGDLLDFTFAFQPNAAYIEAIQNGEDGLEQAVQGKSRAQIIDFVFHELSFKGSISEQYLIDQLENIHRLDGQKTSQKTADDVKNSIQMTLMAIGMQTAKLGIMPIQYKDGVLSVNFSYKEGHWTINDKSFTTEELIKTLHFL